ncbi:MAG: CocE/NonD family hydrolase, partial [Actinomycetia bacterium]|nr:CocE/NonD family hydrolase [Actinomycetes bacterium]
MRDHGKRWRLFFFLVLPLALAARAVHGAWKAFRGRSDKLLVAERDIAPAAPYHQQRRVVQVSAGIPITATVFVPSGEGPFPVIIMVHSWMWWRAQCDLLYAPGFARRGYVVLTYDCRGWGSSGGEVSCAAPDSELSDLEDMITWLVSPEAGLPVDPGRIGITGVSYGGGHSFLAAARDDRIKAAAPMSGWTDLNFSLMPNGCWKTVWSLVLFTGSIWALKFDMKNDLVRWLKTVVLKRNLAGVEGELKERSAIYQVDKVKCPMFIVHSWNDDLFEPNQILDYYRRLNVPKKLTMTNGLHGFDAGRGDVLFPNQVWDDARRWFDYWLKGERGNGIDLEPNVKYYQPWDRKMAGADQWPPKDVKERRLFLRGEHPSAVNSGFLADDPPDGHEPTEMIVNNTVTSIQSSGPPIVRPNVIRNLPIPGVPFSIPGDSVSFTTGPLAAELTIVGAPSVELYLASSTTECQVNALLYDVSPRGFCRLVSHCALMRKEIKPDSVELFRFDLIACAHRFPAGHRVRLVVCASDPLYVLPSLTPSFYRLFHTAEQSSGITL